jgi:hypothetical protein
LVIEETSSKLATRLEVEAYIQGQRNQQERLIQGCLKKSLDGRTHGWHITLNTKAVIEDRSDKYKINKECELLERQLEIFSSRFNEFCYRRRKQCRLKMLNGIEIGDRNRLHAHLIAAHSGDVDKTLSQVDREVAKQWQRVYEFDAVGFIKVEDIYDMKGIVTYVVGETDEMFKKYQLGSFRPF